MLARVLTYLRSQILGLVAIFIALGGTGYAAVAIPRHSVGQPQLKKSAVGRSQLRKHSVTNAKLANASVGAKKLKGGSVTAAKLASGSVGTSQIAAGAIGSAQLGSGSVGAAQLANGSVGAAQIAAGSVGPSQLSGVASYTSAFAIIEPNGTVSASDPAASTSNWSNGNGAITFASDVDGSECIPYSFVPQGVTSGTAQTAASSFAFPSSNTEVSVSTNPPSGTSQNVVVEVLCAA